jgi:N-formylglutamate deformylase
MALKAHCIFRRGNGPVLAAAVHHGHDTRQEVDELLLLSEPERLREEDPYTGVWTQIAPTQIIGMRSRFEVDLNRPRAAAVYQRPEDAWGLNVWKTRPHSNFVNHSLALYDVFYQEVELLLRELLNHHAHLVVYDLHSYNHRRQGPMSPIASLQENPEVNIGTGSINRLYWGPVVDRFIDDLSHWPGTNRLLDVRENVKFQGGHFGRWIHQTFPHQVLSIAIEVKKFFMDEWTGEANWHDIQMIAAALEATLHGVNEELAKL